MGFFKKKRNEIIDLTKDERIRSGLGKKSTSSDYVKVPTTSESKEDDFLSGLAGAGNFESSPGPITNSLRDARKRISLNNELNELRLKLDDSDFKLRNLVEKVREIERRMDDRGI
jgi:hypothetical protein